MLYDASSPREGLDLERLARCVERHFAGDEVSTVLARSRVSLSFVSDDEIRRLNAEYRDIDEATDVLSFPLFEDEHGNFVPPSDWEEIPLGDVVVAPGSVREEGASDELMIVHGTLHLIGFDHDEPEREERMFRAQEEILRAYLGVEDL